MHSILDLDLGNTRLKWRHSGANLLEEGVLENGGLCLDSLLPKGRVDRIRIAAVAPQRIRDQVIRDCRQRWQVEPEIAVVREHCAGVQQGYHDRTRLGVDRWLGILAAYAQVQQSCVVVSCGTAVTVDLVDSKGAHLGGYVVPGLEMMRGALFSGTHAVKLNLLDPGESLAPGRDTQQAVSRGLLLMVKGLVESAVTLLSDHGAPPILILTGGDGERLLPFWGDTSTNARYLPNLVLDGLALALP